MSNHKSPIILSSALTLLLSVPAFGQEPADMNTNPLQLAESTEGKQVQDAMNPAPMDKHQASQDQANNPMQEQEQEQEQEQDQIQRQADINQTISSELYSKRPDELLDKQVRNSNEEVVGKVEAIVSSRQDGQVHVVISKGGFMGIGASEYAVPLHGLSMNEGKLYLRSVSGENPLDKKYEEQGYVSIEPKNQPISEFSAFEERQ